MAFSHAIIGLGNPGNRYNSTRHNVGFMLVDRIAERALTVASPEDKSVSSVPWRRAADSSWKDKLGAQLCALMLGEESILLMKPLSFMNLSGQPVQAVSQFYKIPVEQLVVVHDEVDLPLGEIRLKRGGGDGGHNGVRSIAETMGSKEFLRLRLGVGRPAITSMDTADWVLGRFGADETLRLDVVLERSSCALSDLCRMGLSATQNRYHGAST